MVHYGSDYLALILQSDLLGVYRPLPQHLQPPFALALPLSEA